MAQTLSSSGELSFDLTVPWDTRELSLIAVPFAANATVHASGVPPFLHLQG